MLLLQAKTTFAIASLDMKDKFKNELREIFQEGGSSILPWMNAFYLHSGSGQQDEMFQFYALLRTEARFGGFGQTRENAYLIMKGFLAQQTPDSPTLVAKYGLTAKDMEALMQVKWEIGREAEKGSKNHDYAYFKKRMNGYEESKGRHGGTGAMKYLLDSLGSMPYDKDATDEQKSRHNELKAIFLETVPHFLKDFSNAEAEKLLGKIQNRWPK